MRPDFPSVLIYPNSSSYYPVSIRETRLVPAAFFSETRPRFHSRFQIVICERSCRMAKTLTVNITPILKKESRKRKKNQKKIDFLEKTVKKEVKKHIKRVKSGQEGVAVQQIIRFPHAMQDDMPAGTAVCGKRDSPSILRRLAGPVHSRRGRKNRVTAPAGPPRAGGKFDFSHEKAYIILWNVFTLPRIITWH